jgi:hypothetical protein
VVKQKPVNATQSYFSGTGHSGKTNLATMRFCCLSHFTRTFLVRGVSDGPNIMLSIIPEAATTIHDPLIDLVMAQTQCDWSPPARKVKLGCYPEWSDWLWNTSKM